MAELIAAGAEITGLTHLDELAFGLGGENIHYGTPRNPSAHGRIPGGSSSGCAVAVASGEVDIGLGTDTAGSIRVPASYCGLFGLRTSHGRVSLDGATGLAPSFDTAGFLTRDLAMMRRVASLFLSPAPSVERVLVSAEVVAGAEAATRTAFSQATQGWPVIPAVGARRLAEWFSAFRTVQAAEAWALHGEWITAHPDALGADVRARFERGREVTTDEEATGRQILAAARAQLRALVPAGSALAVPTTSGRPPRCGDPEIETTRAATLRLTFLASVAGLPALSLPLPPVHGYPLGLCLIGAPDSDLALLELAAALEVCPDLSGAV